ncbi:MAG: GMP synthase [Thermodesulfobacteriota bacterium]|nr:GMP synthase [Thermodesulfobacteriota bacterium]
MKAAILQSDNVLAKFQPQFGDYPAMIEQMFDGVDLPLSFDTYDCRQGQFPDDINEYDFYITTGSKASVYDDLPWIQQLVEFVQLLYKQQKKLIGICFGHQIIAMALAGKVEKSEKGWGIGIADNRIIAHPEWMKSEPAKINILVSHQDQIIELPDNTLVIAENDFCPFFIVQWGNHFLSIQGHPEWNTNYSRTLINDRKAIIPADRIKAGLNSLQIAPDNALFVRLIMEFVQS